MRTTIITDLQQAALNLKGELRYMLVKMKQQPIRFSYNTPTVNSGDNPTFWAVGSDLELIEINAPFPLNTKLGVCEAWFFENNSGFQIPSEYRYKCDTNASAPSGWDNIPRDERPDWAKWRSPASMPPEATRQYVTFESVEVVRCREISTEQCDNIIGHIYKIDALDFWEQYIISRYGRKAWDENHYFWYFKIKGK